MIPSLFLLVAGCGAKRPQTAPVAGTVLFNDKPLQTGTVMFIPDTSGPCAYGQIQEDGTYRLTTYDEGDGAVIGTHRVVVSAVDVPNPNYPLPRPLIPMEYSSERTSGLTAEVKDQKQNVVDLTLKSKGKWVTRPVPSESELGR